MSEERKTLTRREFNTGFGVLAANAVIPRWMRSEPAVQPVLSEGDGQAAVEARVGFESREADGMTVHETNIAHEYLSHSGDGVQADETNGEEGGQADGEVVKDGKGHETSTKSTRREFLRWAVPVGAAAILLKNDSQPETESKKGGKRKLTRREFLQVSVLATAGVALTACSTTSAVQTPSPTASPTNVEPTTAPSATPSPESPPTPEQVLDEKYARVLNVLKNQQEWDAVKAGGQITETAILLWVRENPQSDEARRLLRLIDVMTAGGDRINFEGRGVVEFWSHDPNYRANTVNDGQFIVRVDGGGVPDQDTGRVFAWSGTGSLSEEEFNTILVQNPAEARRLGLTQLTPKQGEQIVRTITQEVVDDRVVAEYVSAASVNGESERSKWTDASGEYWIEPVQDPSIVRLERDEETRFYRVYKDEAIKPDGQAPDNGPFYYGGAVLPPNPQEGLLLDEEIVDPQLMKTAPILVKVNDEGESKVIYEYAIDQNGQASWEVSESVRGTQALRGAGDIRFQGNTALDNEGKLLATMDLDRGAWVFNQEGLEAITPDQAALEAFFKEHADLLSYVTINNMEIVDDGFSKAIGRLHVLIQGETIIAEFPGKELSIGGETTDDYFLVPAIAKGIKPEGEEIYYDLFLIVGTKGTTFFTEEGKRRVLNKPDDIDEAIGDDNTRIIFNVTEFDWESSNLPDGWTQATLEKYRKTQEEVAPGRFQMIEYFGAESDRIGRGLKAGEELSGVLLIGPSTGMYK